MDTFEPKKLALLRILEILQKHSDYDHPLTQEEIADYLKLDYGIEIERKAIGRNLSLLQEAGYEVETLRRRGSYLEAREFEDYELRMLIDGVLSSNYITASHSKELINKLCGLSNKYFRAHVKHIHSVNEWNKTDNQALFYNIEQVDEAIEKGVQLHFDYNKYGIDKKLHKTSTHRVSPYQLVLHNQRYYLMSFHEHYRNMTFYRVDHITNMTVLPDQPATPLNTVEGFKNGINYKELASSFPYMYTDKPENMEFIAQKSVIDQIVDWFGSDIRILNRDENTVSVMVKASPNAMEHWAMQYINYVEILKPLSLREKIKDNLAAAQQKYGR